MSYQLITNLVTDPRAANASDGQYSAMWSYGIGDDAGGGGGGEAWRYTTGSPFADCTTFVGGPLKGGTGAPGATVMNTVLNSELVPVTPGAVYSLRIEGMVDQVVAGMTVALYVTFINSANTAVIQNTSLPQGIPVAGQPKVYTVQVTAPQGAGLLRVGYVATVPIGSTLTGNMYATGAMVIPQNAGDAPYNGPYWDGDTPASGFSTYAWLGVPNQSASQQAVTIPNPTAPPKAPSVVPIATFRPFRQLNVAEWSVQEDATPLDPSDTSGGVGQMTLTTNENGDTEYLRRVPIDFSVPSQGTTRGTVLSVGATDGVASIVANSRLDQLNVTRDAAPFTGMLSDGLAYYLRLCGITTGIAMDPDLSTVTVNWPGWSGIVWDQIKKVCSALWIECSLVSNNIVFRDIRQRTAQNYRDSSVGWSFADNSIAQSVAGFYYTTSYSTSVPVLPLGSWDAKVQMFDGLAANTVTTQTISTMPNSGEEGFWASLTSVQQPVAVSNVALGDLSASQYSILAGDNSQYDPAAWYRLGGSVTVSLGEDSRSIIVTVVTPDDGAHAPFSLATFTTVGESTPLKSNSLRVIGTGTYGQKVKMTLSTGRTKDETSTEVGTTVENEFIQTRQQLRECLLWAAAKYAGSATLNVTTGGINRLGESGSYRYPTIAEWNAEYAGKKLSDINTQYAGKKAADLDADQYALVQQDFANQAFGNIAGARVLHDNAYYRISTATNAPASITYSAVRDTTIGDFDTVWAGKKLADYNALWTTYRAMDVDARPLRTS